MKSYHVSVKTGAIVLVFAMLLQILAIPQAVSAGKPKNKKLSICIGESRTLKVAGKKQASFRTSNKNVVSVRKKGKNAAIIVGNAAGTAKIMAKSGKKKTVWMVNVRDLTTQIEFLYSNEVGVSVTYPDVTITPMNFLIRPEGSTNSVEVVFRMAHTRDDFDAYIQFFAGLLDKNGRVLNNDTTLTGEFSDTYATEQQGVFRATAKFRTADLKKVYKIVLVRDRSLYWANYHGMTLDEMEELLFGTPNPAGTYEPNITPGPTGVPYTTPVPSVAPTASAGPGVTAPPSGNPSVTSSPVVSTTPVNTSAPVKPTAPVMTTTPISTTKPTATLAPPEGTGWEPCPVCHATGLVNGEPCDNCEGSGWVLPAGAVG
ncbi:MAG: hypothetical protein J5819_00020 [Eubacterium sp.]|nr:hypothetical protein [Eubacterium sp.]